MAFSAFQRGILIRTAALAASLGALAWMLAATSWLLPPLLCGALVLLLLAELVRYAARTGQEVARFLDAIAFDDTSTSFSGLERDPAFRTLGASMTRVLDQLRRGRTEREEQAQYLQSLISHVPVALVAVEENGDVQLLNLAARRLFGEACSHVTTFPRYGAEFAAAMETLKPGDGTILQMERRGSVLPLKAGATDVTIRGRRRRLISLQNIESELNAKELAAWQTVIRVMAHEVMNSLTPISSLAATARDHVSETLAALPSGDPARAGLEDAGEALDTLARRSEGLLQFVQSHRRLTKRMVAQPQIVPLRRAFSRLHRLLADELKNRDIAFDARVEPETLEVDADIDLLDQALINLVRNAIEALRDTQQGRITLTARQENGGRIAIMVADNGPGVPADQREKVFVPFYTTKRQGSGIGLSLVRQIMAAHGGAVTMAETQGGGATVRIVF